MKISPPIEVVAGAYELWKREEGMKVPGLLIADEYHAMGGGDVLPRTDTPYGLDNAPQRVNRIFSNYNGPRYNAMAEKLKIPALNAMPVMRRCAVTEPEETRFLTAVALKEFTEFINAVNLDASKRELVKEGREARDTFEKLFNLVFPENENYQVTQR